MQLVAAAIDGRTVDQVDAASEPGGTKRSQPHFGVAYTKLAYRPMVQLLRYLEAHGYQTWICSGSPIAYTRAISRDVFGIPPDRVIGSYLDMRFDERGGRTVLTYTREDRTCGTTVKASRQRSTSPWVRGQHSWLAMSGAPATSR